MERISAEDFAANGILLEHEIKLLVGENDPQMAITALFSVIDSIARNSKQKQFAYVLGMSVLESLIGLGN